MGQPGGWPARGLTFEKLTFPQYDQPSSALIKMYLNGEFGQKPGDVNAYAASTFYAVDRYVSDAKDEAVLFKRRRHLC